MAFEANSRQTDFVLQVALIGAGRIGQVHAEALRGNGRAELRWVVDADLGAAERAKGLSRARLTRDANDVFADPAVNAVVIASPTPTHVELIIAAARAGQAIFCEKPLDLDLGRVDRALAELERTGVPCFVGFNRRFDPGFQKLKEDVAEGKIGRLEILSITSRDPGLPSRAYLANSGGMFKDMTIHDLDLARWILAEEPIEVYAAASTLVDPQLTELFDVDTAVLTLRTESGALCQINNSRRASYGYDQRVEAFGEKGMLLAENHRENSVVRWSAEGVISARPPHFFIERYREAYRAELEHFLAALDSGEPLFLTTAADGRAALVLAEAALRSVQIGQPVRIDALNQF